MTWGERGRHRRTAVPTWVVLTGQAMALAVTVLVVGAVYHAPVADGNRDLPVGFDTTEYMFRAKAVIADGVESLDDITPPALHLGTNAERPGHPVIAAMIDGALSVDPLHLSLITPTVMAVAVALAAGAFASLVLREPDWAFPVFGIATGASLLVARTAVGSIDNLMFDAIVLAMLGCAVAFADRERGLAGAMVLAAGATLIHWNLTALSVGLVIGLAVVAAVPSFLLHRRGARWWHTPLPRLLTVATGCVVAGVGAMLVAPSLPTRLPKVPMAKIRKKSRERLPALRLPFFAVASTLGAGAAWLAADGRRRMGAALLVLWAATLPLSALLLAAGQRIPVYRVATFALSLPMLAALLVTTPGRLVARRSPIAGLGLGLALGTAALWVTLPWTSAFWRAQEPISRERFGQALAAAAYLGSISRDPPAPAVFLVSSRKITLPDHLIRGAAPAELVDDVYLFPGKLSDLRALQRGDTAPLTDPSIDRRRATARRIVSELLDEQPVTLFLTAFNGFQQPPRGAALAGPGVFVVEGPTPTSVEEGAPHEADAVDPVKVGALLLIVGSGWAVAMLRGSILVRVGSAMAFGLAVLAVAGTVASRLGLPLDGVPGMVVLGLSTALGWALVAVLGMIRRARPAAAERDDRRDDAQASTDAETTA